MRNFINYIVRKISGLLGTNHLASISPAVQRLREINENILVENFLRDNLLTNPRYITSKRITHFHRSVFTQNGEDGILDEIFKRIGTTNKVFVEFGVHGLKNNSTYLLVKGWKGLWIGANKGIANLVNSKFQDLVRLGFLQFYQEWLTSENIESIIQRAKTPQSFDFLSVDLDGNDYWIWEAITKYKPRVVSIEYNAVFPPEVSWIMQYNPSHKWDQTSYFGASLKALETLGAEKGYKLVGCDFSGCNAFFVHQDEQLDLFQEPFTAQNHYEPPRYFLRRVSGHPAGFGPFLNSR